MTQSNPEITEKLKKATDGLLFMSESEYPLEAFCWSGSDIIPLTEEKIVQQTGHSPDSPVKTVELEDFFRVTTTIQDWHTEEDKQTVAKYQALVETLKNSLSNLRVYKIGEIDIDVYIVGETPEGNLAGLSTHVVET